MIFWCFRTSVKKMGRVQAYVCPNCRNQQPWELIKHSRWMYLFFIIPLLPVGWKYFLACPVCGQGTQIKKQEYKQLLEQIKAAEANLPAA